MKLDHVTVSTSACQSCATRMNTMTPQDHYTYTHPKTTTPTPTP